MCLKSLPPPDLLADAQNDRSVHTLSPRWAALGRADVLCPVGFAVVQARGMGLGF